MSRFAHGEYFESDPGWESAGGDTEAVNSVYQLNTWYANNATVAAAPWAMTAGHLRSRVQAVDDPSRSRNAQLLFDYHDVGNYKLAGLRVGAQKWVIKAVVNDVKSDLAVAPDGSIQADRWYQLDLVVELNKVTLYADGQERVTWMRGSGQRITGGRVRLMARDGTTQFQELEVWNVTAATKSYALSGQRVALRRDGVLSYAHTDHLGSTSVLTDASGHEVAGTRLRSYPYGDPRPADRLQTLTYPGGEVVTTSYSSQGLATSVAGQATYVSGATYDAAGRPDVRTLGSGLATDYDYYPWTQSGGRLQRIRTGNLLDLQYPEYDANGNVKRIVDAVVGQTQEFSYDALDRLLTASAAGGSVGLYTETYAYAANGNLISKTGVGSYGYNAAVSGCSAGTPGTKPHAVAQAGNSAYRYDCNGNMTERAGQVLRYDQENRLTQVIGEAVTTYRYNGDGQRVTLTTGCTTTTYVGAYFEWRGSVATMTSYYYAGGTRVAMRTGTPITGTVSYLLGDHLGSSSVSYRSDGNQTVTQRYYPWGTIRPGPDNALPTDYTFTGQKLDASAGLLYYGARYYDAALGRFIQADTIVPQPGNPQSLNRYSYVLNNPVTSA